MNRTPLYIATILFFGITAKADLATIYLKNGEARTVELESVDAARVNWKTSASATDIQATMRSQIDHVVFPATGAWTDAEEARQAGKLGEAIRLYQEVIRDPASHYYPIPGNFVSLAKEGLLQCFRLQMNAERVAQQAKIVREDFPSLPPEMRKVEPETAAWSAIAEGNWEKAFAAVEGVETPDAETFFLRGRALEALGKKQEAVAEYAGTYVLNFGGSTLLTQTAIQRSSALLHEIGDKDRLGDLKAQVKIYRDLYGKGSLWEGAPEALVSLSDAEIKPLGEAASEMTKPEEPGNKMTGPVVAESAAVATTVPKEERDYLLPEELPDRIYVIGAGDQKETITPNGGVVKEGESYRYDGTGGFLRLEPFNANTAFIQFRIQFESETGDGILAHTREPRLGGMTIYLKGGELIAEWMPRKAKIHSAVIGKIEPNELVNLAVVFRPNGTRNTIIGYEGTEDTIPGGGLKLPQIKHINVGGSGPIDQEGKTLSGVSVPGFKGVIHHFSVGAGADYTEVMEKTVARFGKGVRLLPPPQKAEGEE